MLELLFGIELVECSKIKKLEILAVHSREEVFFD